MAEQIYKVRDPSGAIREIKGPEGATDEQVIAKARELLTEPPKPAPAPLNEAEKLSEGERRMVGVGRSLMKPVEAVQQLYAHATGTGKEADARAQGNAAAMQDIDAASAKDATTRGNVAPGWMPAGALLNKLGKADAGSVQTATDLATAAMIPGLGITKLPTLATKMAAGGLTGGAVSMGTNPVTSGGNFADEKAKQGLLGFGSGAGLTGLFSGLSRVIPAIKERFSKTPDKPVSTEGAQSAVDYLQSIRDRLTGKVGAKVDRETGKADAAVSGARAAGEKGVSDAQTSAGERLRGTQTEVEARTAAAEAQATKRLADAEAHRDSLLQSAEGRNQQRMQEAEKAVASARDAVRGLRATDPTVFGSVARDAMAARKAELESARDEGAMPFLQTALNSNAKVNVAGLPARIDSMLSHEKNMDIERALLKAKKTLYAKDGNAAGAADDIDGVLQKASELMKRVRVEKLGPQSAEAAQARALHEQAKAMMAAGNKADGPQLDTSVRGLDSARLAIRDMMSGNGSEPADKFAAKQLDVIRKDIEKAISASSKDYRIYLDKYAELSKPLDAFSLASGTGRKAGASLQKDKFEGDFMTSPEAMGNRYLQPGGAGAAAVREFKAAVNNDPNAIRAYTEHVAWNLRDIPPEKWGPFLRKHEPALKEIGMYDALKAAEQTAMKAQVGLAGAKKLSSAELAEAGTSGTQHVRQEKALASAEVARSNAISSAQRAASDKASREQIKEAEASAHKLFSEVESEATKRVKAAKGTADRAQGFIKNSVLGPTTVENSAMNRRTGGDAQTAIDSALSGDRATRNLTQFVKMTNKDPRAAQGLREAFGNWLQPKKAEGGVNTKATLERWDSVKDAVKNSGMFPPDHYAAIEKVIGDVRSAESTEGFRKGMGGTIGYVLGMIKGSPLVGASIGKKVMGGLNPRVERNLDTLITGSVNDPAVAKLLSGPVTPETIPALNALAARIAAPAGREAGEQKPSRTLQDAADLTGAFAR